MGRWPKKILHLHFQTVESVITMFHPRIYSQKEALEKDLI